MLDRSNGQTSSALPDSGAQPISSGASVHMSNHGIEQTAGFAGCISSQARYVYVQTDRGGLVDVEKYGRSVGMLCLTCGSDQFSHLGEAGQDHEIITCAGCGRQMTREELIRENSENLSEHVASMAKEITGDLQRELNESLRAAFKGSKNVRFR